MNSDANKRKIWIALIVASCLLVFGTIVFVMYQVVSCYVIAYGSKGEFYDQGVDLLEKGKYAEALNKANLSLKAGENKVESNLLRANALYALDRPLEAASDVALVAKVKPQLAYDLHHQAYVLIEEDGAPLDVVRLESLAMAIVPNIPKFYVNRSYAYSDLDMNDKAIDYCTFALAIKPIDDDATESLLLNRATAYNASHRHQEALQDSLAGLKVKNNSDEDRWRLLNVKVEALIGLKKYQEAITDCNHALELVGEDKEWVITFKELKMAALLARNNKELKDFEAASKLKSECKKLKESIESDEKAQADKIREESGGD